MVQKRAAGGGLTGIDSPAPGFRQIGPHLHQWQNGNAAVITSDDESTIVIDSGLCLGEPEMQRLACYD